MLGMKKNPLVSRFLSLFLFLINFFFLYDIIKYTTPCILKGSIEKEQDTKHANGKKNTLDFPDIKCPHYWKSTLTFMFGFTLPLSCYRPAPALALFDNNVEFCYIKQDINLMSKEMHVPMFKR